MKPELWPHLSRAGPLPAGAVKALEAARGERGFEEDAWMLRGLRLPVLVA